MMRYDELSDEVLCALCVYREARGEGELGKRGVAHVILNRMKANKFFGHDVRSVILKPYQFSSFNASDPNVDVWPHKENDAAWTECVDTAGKVLLGQDPDLTNGALYYFSPPLTEPPHAWGPVELTLETGNLKFYKPVLVPPIGVEESVV